ncbi:rRNA methyltransferase [Streptomyces sp. LBUM 1478]|uniref:small ribosomal subunit Rsm22 family protein n=3 Tax=Streptomyces scabiei TaxID=1930 RepID=UPI000765D98B|nr:MULTISPECIES: small ribosomal subunit Rsm22 family protein [Streptomyces]MBP5864104.1 rRNA methyltransferase [Streptomyces sp. LBUM 1484]MBP5905572.1 rRNA methyltransferase [Streptomyces sp. LBUM 1478]MBP5932019.1 rRNA methyltransferase [Streptomyces sp. LBUM 1479]MBP5875273.1 rRNA methyltransferase [Streptomyces sp. LBUM 1477]MBP5894088.1 rRNA methyltransferase [Streptomyces sp. LBUM 1481]
MNAPAPASAAETLRTALAGLLDGLPPKSATRAVERLIANYRGRTPTDAPVLRDRSDVVAYAAYRMPATFEAVCSALEAFAAAVPGWVPGSHVDVGGGTGAATWAVNATWAGSRPVTVLDWAEPALALGREIAAANPELKAAAWQRSRIGAALTIESTDLVTVSYVLGELTAEDRTAVVEAAATAARAVVIIEPGTPEGYARVIEARTRLVAAGFHIAAPCPHSAACPIVPGEDWCHFAARVSRSSLHRQVKGGSLPYEDEKFSYVAATRFPPSPAPARVVRKPQIRKGLVLLDLCETEPALGRTTVTKRHGPLYRAARDTDWGDAWPPPGDDEQPGA